AECGNEMLLAPQPGSLVPTLCVVTPFQTLRVPWLQADGIATRGTEALRLVQPQKMVCRDQRSRPDRAFDDWPTFQCTLVPYTRRGGIGRCVRSAANQRTRRSESDLEPRRRRGRESPWAGVGARTVVRFRVLPRVGPARKSPDGA